MKKILGFMMALAVIWLPTVNAEGAEVAQIGDAKYNTIAEAINAAQENDTIVLLKSTTESITIPKGKNIILDLGTFTLTNVDKQHTIVNKGTLTIKGNGVVDNVSHTKGALVNNGTFVLESGKLTRSAEKGIAGSNGGNSWYVIDNNGTGLTGVTMTIKGGEVVNTSGFSSLIRNLEATITVEDGKLQNTFIALKNDDNGVVSITGGEITSTGQESALQNWGVATISGGTLNAEGGLAVWGLSWSTKYNAPKTIVEKNAVLNGNVRLSIDENYPTVTVKPEMEINGGKINGNIEVKTESKLTVNDAEITGKIMSDTSNTNITIALKDDNKEQITNEDGTISVVYKKADYTKVEEAIKKATDLKKENYKDFSEVEKAINAVVEGKDIREQATVDAYAVAINEAIDALEMKLADYSKVEEAIEKANALKKEDYKDFSKVEEALAAVIKNKDITEQATVDAYAVAINEAIDALEKVEEVVVENPNTGDNILLVAGLGMISLIGLAGSVVYKKKVLN